MTRLDRRRALLIGNETYADSRFGALPSVRADTWQLEQVLSHRQIGGFYPVRRVADLTRTQMQEEIASFLGECEEDELAFLYVSGHGLRHRGHDGQFYFVASDTDPDNLAGTGVPAGFVNEALETCLARQKIVMIDCCNSGGFALGFRTADPPAAKGMERDQPERILITNGVYVVSSSQAWEVSRAGAVVGDDVEPSAFTAEVVEALRTGQASRDASGEVTVADLFATVGPMVQARTKGAQGPVISAQGVSGRIVIASCPQGGAPVLAPMKSQPADLLDRHRSRAAKGAPGWPELLDYYSRCLRAADRSGGLLAVTESATFACLPGRERFLSGDLDADGCVAIPEGDELAAVIDRHRVEGGELWTGYPVVYFDQYPHGRQDRKVFAPLLIRRVELVDVDGDPRLRPIGPVLPHPRLGLDFLGSEQFEHFRASYRPTWHAYEYGRMAVDIGIVLRDDFTLDQVQALRPDDLEDSINSRNPGDGARNAAVLYISEPGGGPHDSLLKDLDEIAGASHRIEATALAALAPDFAAAAPPPPECDPATVRIVAPKSCNAAQEWIIRSAMARRLTVATGPPGTGKSQLVVNLIATAVAAGQTVLVASTNNAAVDEVWKRCTELVDGSAVRTGAVRYRSGEFDQLHGLRLIEPSSSTLETAGAELYYAQRRQFEWMTGLEERAKLERALLDAGQRRQIGVRNLGRSSISAVLAGLSGRPLDVVALKASAVSGARFFPRWQRRRFLSPLGFTNPSEWTAETCTRLAAFAAAQQDWLSNQQALRKHPDDDTLVRELAIVEEAVQSAALTLLDSTVRSSAAQGSAAITELLDKLNSRGSNWGALRKVLPFVRGWAVTCLKARNFPVSPGLFDLVVIDEASQCAIPHVLPLLYRARRALIIGDPMQLKHIPALDENRDAQASADAAIPPSWFENRRLNYVRDSAYHAAEQIVGRYLLDEHFRCHPVIADVVNRLFYNKELTVLTDIRGRPTLADYAPIVWNSVVGQAQRREGNGSWFNRAEVDAVVAEVERLREPGRLPAGTTIGVVTPFRAQADQIERRLDDSVRVGTAHRFQGGECDIMIFSLVASRSMSIRSINWVDHQLNLWNVAITRARSHLVLIGDPAVWAERRITAELIAAAKTAAVQSNKSTDVDLLHRLYASLRDQPGAARVQLAAPVLGRPADLRIEWNEGTVTAMLLDSGADANHAAHLHLMLRRRQLQQNLEAGILSERVAGWRLFEIDE